MALVVVWGSGQGKQLLAQRLTLSQARSSPQLRPGASAQLANQYEIDRWSSVGAPHIQIGFSKINICKSSLRSNVFLHDVRIACQQDCAVSFDTLGFRFVGVADWRATSATATSRPSTLKPGNPVCVCTWIRSGVTEVPTRHRCKQCFSVSSCSSSPTCSASSEGLGHLRWACTRESPASAGACAVWDGRCAPFHTYGCNVIAEGLVSSSEAWLA